MRNTKLWSVLLAFVLLGACVLGVFFMSANAAGEVVYGVGYTEGIDEDKQFATIQDAFAAVETAIEKGEWTEGDTLVIKFAGTIEGKVEESELLFGQKTIFTSTGKKLPVTILGTEESRASTVKVTADNIACANDYTFKAMTLDLHSHVSGTGTFKEKEYNLLVNFFAGSGNVTMDDVATFQAGSQVFADNYTAEAYEGWTVADVEALKDEDGCLLSSVTFTNTGFENGYSVNEDAGDLNDFVAGLAAVGATRDAATGADPYAAVINENCTITPADTKAMVLVTDGEVLCRVGGYVAEYPARVHTAIIRQTGGKVNALAGDEAGGHILNNIENGNIVIYAENAPQTGTVRVFYGGNGHNDMTNTADAPAGEYGNVTVTCKNIKKGGSAFMDGSGNKTVPGKVSVTLEKFHHGDKTSVGTQSTFEFIGIGGLGGIENTLKQCRITAFSGTRYTEAKTDEVADVVNTLTDVVYTGSSSKYPFQAMTYRTNSPKLKAKSITNNLTNVQFGSSTYAISYYGSRNVTVSGDVTNNLTDCVFNNAESGYRGAYAGSAVNVKNNFKDCTLKAVYGVYNGTYTNVYNNFTDTVCGKGVNGTYNANVTGQVSAEVNGESSFDTFYSIYAGSSYTIGDVKNTFNGGTFNGDVLLGGYGGKSVKSVTNTINGGHFSNTGKMLCCGAGNHNWTGQVLGDVVNNFNGGTFDHVVYAGARAGCVQSDIINNIKSGTFNSNFYGGNYAPTYYRTDYDWFNDFLNKSVVGTIYNYVGEEGKVDTAPVFNKNFYGGDRGDVASKNARINTLDTDIENTVYNATFNSAYFGGNGEYAYRTIQTDITAPEIKVNVTNTILGGSFKGSYMGGGNGGSYVAEEGEIAAKIVGGLIKNDVRGGTFTGNFFAAFGANAAEMTIDIENHFSGGQLVATENYMGSGNNSKMTGTITNTFEDGLTTNTAYVYCAGTGIVTAPQGKKAVVNTINGGSFDGIWGAGGNANLVVNGDVETTVNGGTFNTYDSKNLINGIAGGPRNGTLNGNATLTINGGTFAGQVSGGTFLGSSDYKDRQINGSTALIINGGTFEREIFACSPTETVTATGGSTVKVVPTVGKELSIFSKAEITELDASSDAVIGIGADTLLEIKGLNGTLKVNQTQQWKARTYAIVELVNAPITYTANEGVNGKASVFNEGSTTELRGYGINFEGATLLLSDRIKIKMLLNAELVDALPADYEFTFTTEDGVVLATVNAENIGQAKDGVYTIVLDAMGLSDFDKTILCEGNYLYGYEMTVISLADLGAEYYTQNQPDAAGAQLFKSIADLGRKANDAEAKYGEPVTSAVNWTATEEQSPKALDARLNMKTVGLVMTDAIGIRLTGETVAADTPLKFLVNGHDVTSSCTVTRAETADETSGKYAFTVEMYVHVARMTDELDLVIADDADASMFTMTLRVDSLAEKIYAANNQELTSFALAYIQAADAYLKAQEA